MEQFQEAKLGSTPLRALGLAIEGTRLEAVIGELLRELDSAEIRIRPRFYLSTEWGVPFETIAMAIPYYLAHPELEAYHARRTSHVEGRGDRDILRYLRHEMGHVVNYAYKLYERREWVERFGAITQPYIEEYRPIPWSPRFVRHLPGWYAQKHPDEDWAETFAVWLTPGLDWRREYQRFPEALSKLDYVDVLMRELRTTEPLVTDDALDEPVEEIDYSLDDLYKGFADVSERPPVGLDGALAAVFDWPRVGNTSPASELIQRCESDLVEAVYTWTGHFPERTRSLLEHLAARADELGLVYVQSDAPRAIVALTACVTGLAMNHVHHGRYSP